MKQFYFSMILLLFTTAGFAQASSDKYISVYDSTGTVKAFFLLTDTARLDNPSLMPPGSAIPLFNEKEEKIGNYILNDKRTWIFTLDKKPLQ